MTLQAIHNTIICSGSLVIFVGCLYEVYSRSVKDGSILWLVCEEQEMKSNGRLWFWSYIYYLSKYYELLDTVIQLLRGKLPPNYFLHVYHHSFILLMCWFWLEYSATMQFVGLLFNTAVHIVMYFYFFLRSIGRPPAWKALVTQFQIIQFVTSLVCFGFTLYLIYGTNRICKSMGTLYAQLLFNVTLLYGFIGVLTQGRTTKKLSSRKN